MNTQITQRKQTSLEQPRQLTINGIRYTAKDRKKKAWATLPNGIKLLVYPGNHCETIQFLKRCLAIEGQKKTKKQRVTVDNPHLLLTYVACCLMKVQINTAEILVLLELYPPMPRYICNKAMSKVGLNDLLKEILYLSYHNRFHIWSSKEGKQLVESIRRGLAPEVCKLVYPQW